MPVQDTPARWRGEGVMEMRDMQAYCGLVCEECPAHKATQADDREMIEDTARMWSEAFGEPIDPDTLWCDGCKSDSGRRAMFCGICRVRACATEWGMSTCAECPDYSCEALEAFFKMAPEAREGLERLRRARGSGDT